MENKAKLIEAIKKALPDAKLEDLEFVYYYLIIVLPEKR